VFTNDDKIAEIIKSLRVHGKGTSKYDNIRIGINSRLDTLQAGILLAKLDALDNEIDLRQKVAGRYNEALKNIMVTPYIKADDISSYAQYIIMVESMKQRDDIRTNIHAMDTYIIVLSNTNALVTLFQGCFMGDETFSNSIRYSERT
jgi:dTDP-4-amino-4,6-dideoxygalactose transaminase